MSLQRGNFALIAHGMSNPIKAAFIGLGVMGGPMTGHLARAGHHVTAYNRNRERAAQWRDKWAEEGLEVAFADTPAAAAEGADIVFTCVGNDQDLQSVTLDAGGVLEGMATGSLLVDHTTVSANMARQLAAAAAERNVDFIDAPVSGGQAGAENGALAIMCGGSEAAMARATPVMDCYAGRIVRVGDAVSRPGASQPAVDGLPKNWIEARGRDPARSAQVISSIRSSATRAHRAVAASTLIGGATHR